MRQTRKTARHRKDRRRKDWTNTRPGTAMRQTALCLGFGLLAGLGPAAALADYVVIAASGASGSYTAGTVIADDQQIDLPEGTKLTLIERSGRMVTLEGLFSGTVPAPGETDQSDTPSIGWAPMTWASNSGHSALPAASFWFRCRENACDAVRMPTTGFPALTWR